MPKFRHILRAGRHIMGVASAMRCLRIMLMFAHITAHGNTIYMNRFLGFAIKESFKFQFSGVNGVDVVVKARHSGLLPMAVTSGLTHFLSLCCRHLPPNRTAGFASTRF